MYLSLWDVCMYLSLLGWFAITSNSIFKKKEKKRGNLSSKGTDTIKYLTEALTVLLLQNKMKSISQIWALKLYVDLLNDFRRS